jgi:hypothetical protein
MPKNNGAVKVAPDRLKSAYDLIEWIGVSSQEVSFAASERTRVGAACFAVVQEHHQSIVILTEHRIFASSFALLRVAFDAYVRGVWLSLCATDAEVAAFLAGKEPGSMKSLLTAIESKPEFSNGELSSVKDRSWSAMCDYTHTGSLQVQRWNTEDAVEPRYTIDEVMEVLQLAELLGMMSVISFAGLINNVALSKKALEKITTM